MAVLAMFLQYVGRVLSLLAGALRGRLEACFAECSEPGENFAHTCTQFLPCVKKLGLASKCLGLRQKVYMTSGFARRGVRVRVASDCEPSLVSCP